MKYDDLVVLDIGKIVVKRNFDKKYYYKEIENGFIELTEQEREVIDNIFYDNYGYIFYSEKLNVIVYNNNKLENKSYLMNFFEYIERMIPEDCRDNFYHNLETLETKLNFDTNFLDLEVNNEENINTSGNYNTKDNKLSISELSLKKTFEIAKKNSNPENFFWTEINLTVLHELFHMASSKYNKETEVSLCGFNTYPTDIEEECNRGLTEGLTEVLSFGGIPDAIEVASGYYIECLFVNQLALIIEFDVILESYFANKGIGKMKKALNTIINNEELATVLFRKIEDNFYLGENDCKQTITASIQSILINYFKAKLLNDINNGVEPKVIKAALDRYKNMLVTNSLLQTINKKPENYIGLANSIMQFNELKTEIITLISADQLNIESSNLIR